MALNFGKAAPKKRIVLAWMDRDSSPPRVFAVVWRNSVAESAFAREIERARNHASTIGAAVYVYPMSEKKPLEKARKLVQFG